MPQDMGLNPGEILVFSKSRRNMSNCNVETHNRFQHVLQHLVHALIIATPGNLLSIGGKLPDYHLGTQRMKPYGMI